MHDIEEIRVNRDTPIGYVLAPIKKRAVIQLMGSRLWGRFNPNHWDAEYAASTGLSAPIQTGEMSSAYISEMCVNHFGENMFLGARVTCKYVSSVLADEIITVRGVITQKTEEATGVRFAVDVWAENQHGEKKTVGHVDVLVRDSSTAVPATSTA